MASSVFAHDRRMVLPNCRLRVVTPFQRTCSHRSCSGLGSLFFPPEPPKSLAGSSTEFKADSVTFHRHQFKQRDRKPDRAAAHSPKAFSRKPTSGNSPALFFRSPREQANNGKSSELTEMSWGPNPGSEEDRAEYRGCIVWPTHRLSPTVPRGTSASRSARSKTCCWPNSSV